MILIPQKLFGDPRVSILLRDGNVCILQKELHEPVLNREGYISNHVISILLSGVQHIKTYEEQQIHVKAGQVLFIPRGLYAISDLLPQKGPFQSLLFYFDDDLIQEFLSQTKIKDISRKSVPSHLLFPMHPNLELFSQSLLDIYSGKAFQDKKFLRLKILELMFLLNAAMDEQQFANFLFQLSLPQKRNIRPFMEKNFDKPLKIEDYAYLTGRSLSTFRRDFKAYFDQTPQRWIKEKRMEKAMKVLRNREMSVTELAYEVGYENISYFIKEFKQKYGQSPKQYMLGQHRNRLR
ncbi:MAG: AraC family transcriptional regulator [Bacteroidota bacterium]